MILRRVSIAPVIVGLQKFRRGLKTAGWVFLEEHLKQNNEPGDGEEWTEEMKTDLSTGGMRPRSAERNPD